MFGCSIVANGSSAININGITADYVSQFLQQSNGWNVTDTSGIVFSGNNNSIQNSTIENSAGDGIMMFGYGNSASNNVVSGCDYNAYDDAGIRTIGGGDTIQNNTVSNCGRDGIKFSSTTDTQVLGNTVFNVMLQTTDGGGIYTYGTNGFGSVIANNRIYNVYSGGFGSAGLYLDNGSFGFTVRGNTVFDCNIGIKMNPPSYNETIEDNTLLGNLQSVASYGSEDMSGSKFTGNIFNNLLQIKGSVILSGNSTVSQSYVPAYGSTAVPSLNLVSGGTPSGSTVRTHSIQPQVATSPTPTSSATSAAPAVIFGPLITVAAPASSYQQLVELSTKESTSSPTSIAYSVLPAAIAKAFRRAHAGKQLAAYYQFTINGQSFYSVHFGRTSKRRAVLRVSATGRVLSRQTLNGAAARADRSRAANA